VSAGLSTDSTYEPYLTTDYKQWKNVVYSTEGLAVKNNSKTVFTSSILTPRHLEAVGIDGLYDRTAYQKMSIDTAKLKGSLMYRPIINTLLASTIGKLDKTLTVIANTNSATLGDKYSYTIKEISAVFTDSADEDAVGTPVGDHRYVKVVYDYTVTALETGEKKTYVSVGLIDLEDETGSIPETVKEKLRAAKVGELEVNDYISFEMTYDEENASYYDLEYVIDNITLIVKFDEFVVLYPSGLIE
jgi:hypothetical protein